MELMVTDKRIGNLLLKTGVKEPIFCFMPDKIKVWELISGIARISVIINKEDLSTYNYDFEDKEFSVKMDAKILSKVNTNNFTMKIDKGVTTIMSVKTRGTTVLKLAQIELSENDIWKPINYKKGLRVVYSNSQDFFDDFDMIGKEKITITITHDGIDIEQDTKGLLLQYMNKNNDVKVEGEMNKITGRYDYNYIKMVIDILRKVEDNSVISVGIGSNKLLKIKSPNVEFYLAPILENE